MDEKNGGSRRVLGSTQTNAQELESAFIIHGEK